MANTIRRVLSVLREEGPAGIMDRGRDRFAYRYRKYAIMARSDDKDPFSPEMSRLLDRFSDMFQIDWLAPDDSQALEKYVEYRRRPRMTFERVRANLTKGRLCILARRDGRLVGDVWMSLVDYPTPVQSDELEAAMDERGLAYSYMGYVTPAARGQGVYVLLLRQLLRKAREAGKQGLFGCVLPGSVESRSTVERLGFHEIGKIEIRDFLGKSRTRLYLSDG